MAAFAAEVAAELVRGLEVMLPFEVAKARNAAELPRLEQLLDGAVADLEKIYAHFAALDVISQPDWQVKMELDALGVRAPARLVHPGKAELPSVRGRKIEFETKPDPCATSSYRITTAQLGEFSPPAPSAHNGNNSPQPPSAPISIVTARYGFGQEIKPIELRHSLLAGRERRFRGLQR